MEWNYEPYIPPRPYVVAKDYGDIVLLSPVYMDDKGIIYIDKTCLDNLPADITEKDMDATWIKVYTNYEK